MTIGVGGSTAEEELEQITNMTDHIIPITQEEYGQRLNNVRKMMRQYTIDALFVFDTNMYYFTGTRWYPSERTVGVIIFAQEESELHYIIPSFEIGTLKEYMGVKGKIHGWEEHQSPFELIASQLSKQMEPIKTIALDETLPFFIVEGIQNSVPLVTIVNGKKVTAPCRMKKSDSEIALIQCAKNITLTVHKAAARILHEGITSQEVNRFINEAHKKAGADNGSYFCIVLFGEDTQYPHGVQQPRPLQNNSVVLIDTGCSVQGYISDITRTYVFGTPTDRQREIWNLEKKAQTTAFNAAQIGKSCASVDNSVRQFLIHSGLERDYKLPGLPHRTGHGTGLDIHEYPYLVGSDETLLEKGMVMSNEPMICIPGEFGIRHEDHFYMTDEGPQWFTQPMKSIDDPFGEN